MTSFFEEWFGIHAGREIFKDHGREFIERSEELEFYVQYCRENKAPAYMSVQPFSARDQVYGLENLFFDFDCKEDLGRAWKDAKTFAEAVATYYKAKPFITFSGHKGYHVYVFLERTVYFQLWHTEFIKEVYEKLQRKVLKGLNLETLDQAIVGDIKRLARVPFSVHEKTGKQCVPVDLEGKNIQVKSLEPFRKQGLDTKLIEVVCREIVYEKKWAEIRAERKRTWKPSKNGAIRPCIEASLSLPLHTGSGHKMRIAIATEYLHKGASVDQVVELFRPQVDFGDGNKTRYYVVDIAKKGYKPFKCETIRGLGFCLGDSCPLYKKGEGA